MDKVRKFLSDVKLAMMAEGAGIELAHQLILSQLFRQFLGVGMVVPHQHLQRFVACHAG